MKIFAYALREYDEKDIYISACEEAGVELGNKNFHTGGFRDYPDETQK